MNPTVVALLKAPQPGLVKTRLARVVGREAAASIYRDLAGQQWRRLPPEWRREIHFAPGAAEAEMMQWLPGSSALHPQSAGDLGARLVHALQAAFAAGGRPVFAIGGDCPELDAECLRRGARLLETADVVLGPATDGGYYLIGLQRPTPELFHGIPWSTAAVLEATVARARALGLQVRLLERKADIDDYDDWVAHRARDNRDVTVVVPTLNEAERIESVLRNVAQVLPEARRVVVDGGSTDSTSDLARSAGAHVISSAQGRGVQLAHGAAVADTPWMLFLHADTLLPRSAARVMRDFMERPDARVATFRLAFDRAGWFLRGCGWCTRFDSVFTRFGDQGILIRRSFYEAIGGFMPWPLFEDVDLLRRARRSAPVVSLRAAVTTSARRFERHGHLRQQWLNARLLFAFLTGTSPHELAQRYRAARRRSADPATPAVASWHEAR